MRIFAVFLVSLAPGQAEGPPAPIPGPPPAVAIQDDNVELALKLVATINCSTLPTQARVAAARTLGLMGFNARSAVPDLTQILGDPFRGYPFLLDEALIQALGRMGVAAKPAIPAMVRNAGRDCDLDRAINESVAQILRGGRGLARVAGLAEQLRSPLPAERLRAAKELTALGVDAREAVQSLGEALTDTDGDVRRQAFRALTAILPGVTPGRAMVGVLIRDLTDQNEAIRLSAVKSLARIGPPARIAIPTLQAAAKSDPDDDVRRLAGDAVAKIQGAPADGGQ